MNGKEGEKVEVREKQLSWLDQMLLCFNQARTHYLITAERKVPQPYELRIASCLLLNKRNVVRGRDFKRGL